MKPLKWHGDKAYATSAVVNGHYAFAYSTGLWGIVTVNDDKIIKTSRARSFFEAKRAAANELNQIHTKDAK